MSYDLEIGVKVADTNKIIGIKLCEPSHPTYNVGGMIRACTGWDFTQGEWYKVVDVIPQIEKGIHEMRFNKEHYKELLPPNGWGNYSTVRNALQGILDTAQYVSDYEELPLEYLYVRW